MSASREKKKRQDLYSTGDLSKTPSHSGGSSVWKKVVAIVCAVVFVVAFVLVMFANSGFLPAHLTAATVNNYKLTASMYSYFYQDSISTIQNYFGQYWSSIVDPYTPYDEQIYDQQTGQTWAEYFHEYTNDAIVETYAVKDAADAAGFTLDKETMQYISDSVASLSTTATSYGYNSADAFLQSYYGKGCNTESYQEYLTLQHIASSYATQIQASYSYTDEELESYYEANANDYDMVNFRVYMFDGTGTADDNIVSTDNADTTDEESETTEPTEEEKAAALAEAERKGAEMAAASAGDENEFLRQAFMADFGVSEEEATANAIAGSSIDTDTLMENYTYSYSTSLGGTECADWLFDSSRSYGDTTAITYNDSYSCVLFYISREDNDYNMVNVRHILITPEETESTGDEEADAAAEQAAKDAAKEEAESLLDQYLAGEQTEDAFAALANEYSAAPGSNTNGGLYENIYQGQMVETFNDWCFNPIRKPGDTGIVESEHGYHIMYYVGTTDTTYRLYLAQMAKLNEDFTAWKDTATEGYTVSENSLGMRFVKTN